MRSVFVHGELTATDLQSLISAAGADGQSSAAYEFGPVRIVILVGNKYFFRTGDHLGLVVVAASNGTSQRVDISAAGGGKGGFLTGVAGASEKLESEVYDALNELLTSRSLGFETA